MDQCKEFSYIICALFKRPLMKNSFAGLGIYSLIFYLTWIATRGSIYRDGIEVGFSNTFQLLFAESFFLRSFSFVVFVFVVVCFFGFSSCSDGLFFRILGFSVLAGWFSGVAI